MATIEVRIKEGKTSIEVSGVEDASCVDLTRILQEALGTVENLQTKPEYFIEMEDMSISVHEGE